MKENSMKEDIIVIEKLIRTMEQDIATFKDEKSKEIYAYFIKALKNILSVYKRVLKENEELKKELGRVTYGRNQLFEYATAQQANPEMLHKILRVEYISKQKIKDKIEELKKWIYTGENAPQDFLQYRIKAKIQALQDLLEEKGE